jgi:predicted acyltransferase
MSPSDSRIPVPAADAQGVPLASPAPPAARIPSLDQFRGYTVAGMWVVNFLGGFAVTPALLKHHNTYCSYADTIMPQFLFAVGFAFRLTFGRRTREQGLTAAYRRVVRRLGGLVLLSVVLYSFGVGMTDWRRMTEAGIGSTLGELAKRHRIQTLLHIAVTSLWILPVIRASAAIRITWMVLSAAAHVALSAWFNFAWVNSAPKGIDGGPLGFLTWSIPALVGTLACDAVAGSGGKPRIGKLLAWSAVLMTLGYAASCLTRLYDVPQAERKQSYPELADSPVLFPGERLAGRDLSALLAEPPFVPPPGAALRQGNYWMMSQRSGAVSYLTFAAGFSLAVFVLFHLVCDRLGWRLGHFRTLGVNALAAYILGGMVEEAVQLKVPRDAPAGEVAAAFVVFFLCGYLLARLLEWKRIVLRL